MASDVFVDEKQQFVKTRKPQLLPPKGIWFTASSHLTVDFYNGFFPAILPMLVAKLDLSLALVGSLVSILSIFNSLLQPAAGFFADKLRRNYFIVFSPLVAGFFMSLVGVVNHYYTLAIVLALSGIGTALFHPEGAALVGRITKNRPGFSMSIFNMGGSLGFAIGPMVVVPLVTLWGLQATLLTIVPAFVILFFTRSLLDISPVAKTEKKNNLHENLRGYWKFVILLYIMVVIRATTTISLQSFVPLYLTSNGNTALLGAVALAVFQVCGTIGILVGGYFSDRMNSRNLLKLSFLLTAPFALLFIHFPSAIGLPFLGIAAFFLFSSTPVNIILGQQILPQNASFISGIMMGFAWGLGGLLATPVGILADWLGLYSALFIISLMVLIGVVLAYLCPCSEQKNM